MASLKLVCQQVQLSTSLEKIFQLIALNYVESLINLITKQFLNRKPASTKYMKLISTRLKSSVPPSLRKQKRFTIYGLFCKMPFQIQCKYSKFKVKRYTQVAKCDQMFSNQIFDSLNYISELNLLAHYSQTTKQVH